MAKTVAGLSVMQPAVIAVAGPFVSEVRPRADRLFFQCWDMIYRLAEPADWKRAVESGFFESADLAAEGFIHFSEAGQVQRTADKYYQGRLALILLAVDETKVNATVIRENTTGGTELFPHVYGRVPLQAVVWSEELRPGTDGRFDLSGKLS